MAKLKLDAIKRGLTSFQGTLKSKKDALLARLARKEKISDEEEHWLDNDANDVDECALIQELETASDFERGVARLDSAKQKLLAKLNRLAGGDSDTESVKPATEKAKKSVSPAVLQTTC
jgi:hypothetical protein